MSAAAIEAVSERLAALAAPKRIAILEALRDGEASVQELADRLDITHRNASHQLAVLYREGVLTRRQDSLSVLYAIEDWSALWLVEQVALSLAEAGV
ncbi:MAG TPA: metalloregulator ArsR/SmtB family transcription factor [Solirubrobacterales bacterium]